MYIIGIFVAFIYIFVKQKKSLHMLQQNWYNDGNRYINWIFKNKEKVFLDLDVFFLIFIIFLFLSEGMNIFLFSLFYLIMIYFSIINRKKEQVKKPLVYTKRIKRLIITSTIIYLIPVISTIIFYDSILLPYYYLILGSLIYLNYFVVLLANCINVPIEKCVFYYYKFKAIKKLKSMSNTSVVGITGSYGKTSSKNILNDVLNVKLTSFKTPKNFNTTNGLMVTINNYLDKFNDIFIAEMGAFKMGEIKELCDLVHPKYGILTRIGTAHLDSFGSQENIQKGKFELIESLPSDGIGILNRDDEFQVSYKLKNKCKIVWIGIDNDADVMATNIKLSHTGTTFDCIIKGDKKKYTFTTRLLGKANVYNILASIALGRELGLSMDELMLGVKKVSPIEHRLELKKYGNISIIDDAYNSNPVGSKMAVEVLGMMPGKKIIVTPGMIELADLQYELNKKFGTYIASVCDEVILIGREQTKPIYDGLKEKKYQEEHIHILQDVKEAFPLMQKLDSGNTYVLLENDLPDIFNEK